MRWNLLQTIVPQSLTNVIKLREKERSIEEKYYSQKSSV